MGIFDKLFGKGKGSAPKRKRVSLSRRFGIYGPLGNGSMSKVYRATDRELGREVCLKILDKKQHLLLVSRFPGLKRPEEGEVAVTLKHPNVVETYDWGWTTKDEVFISMELIKGVGLNVFTDTEGRRPLNKRLDYLIQAADGLAYFHQMGYIHRDISPKNIMVTNEGIAKLIDFGLCVPNKPEFKRPGNRTGTVKYMAPELIKRATTDQRIDVFSFGVSVYEVLTGSAPWEQSEESMQEMLQHVNRAGRDPREMNANLDEETAQVILKGIARDPKERYQSMKEFADALRTLEPKKIPDPIRMPLPNSEGSDFSKDVPKRKPAKKAVKRPGPPPAAG